jgi:hypothetical protein
MLVNIRLHDRVGLDVDRVTPSVGFDAQGEICVRIHIPEETSKKPKSSIPVTERRVSCFKTNLSTTKFLVFEIVRTPTYLFARLANSVEAW